MQHALAFNYPNHHAERALFIQDAAGAMRPASRDEILAVARETILQKIHRGQAMARPEIVRDFLRLRLNMSLPREVFAVLYLNSQNELIAFEEPFGGTLSSAPVYPREIVRAALLHNAASVILAHNHPSGKAEPSKADISVTHRIRDALAFVDMRVLDHLIVAGSDMVSLAERGLI